MQLQLMVVGHDLIQFTLLQLLGGKEGRTVHFRLRELLRMTLIRSDQKKECKEKRVSGKSV